MWNEYAQVFPNFKINRVFYVTFIENLYIFDRRARCHVCIADICDYMDGKEYAIGRRSVLNGITIII